MYLNPINSAVDERKKEGANHISMICTFSYSMSTKTNAFCLGIILCNVSRSFDYLIYPYYPAYTS